MAKGTTLHPQKQRELHQTSMSDSPHVIVGLADIQPFMIYTFSVFPSQAESAS
jgi:hypothetical protein